MDLGRILVAIRRRWWMLAVALVVGIAGGLLAMRVIPAEYTSTARLFVSTTGGTSSSESYSGEQFSQQRNASYAQMIASDLMAQKVIDELKLPMSAGELSKEITATSVPRTVLLDVSVTDRSAERAAAIVNTLAAQFIAFVGPLETPVGQNEPRSTITIVDRAEVARTPTSPRLGTNLFYGALVGIVVGMVWIGVATLASRRIRTVEDLARLVDAPVLGPIDISADGVESRLSGADDWTRQEAEDFRRVRVLVDAQRPAPRVMLVSSASRDAAAAGFASSLAAAFCEAGQPTVLIVTAGSLGFGAAELGHEPGEAGLAELLDGRARPEAVVRATSKPKLSLVLPGSSGSMDSVLSSPAMSQTVESLKTEFDRILIVTPSVDDSSAAAVLSAISDASLLVVNPKTASRGHVQRTMSEYNSVRAHLLGAILVNVSRAGGRSSAHRPSTKRGA